MYGISLSVLNIPLWISRNFKCVSPKNKKKKKIKERVCRGLSVDPTMCLLLPTYVIQDVTSGSTPTPLTRFFNRVAWLWRRTEEIIVEAEIFRNMCIKGTRSFLLRLFLISSPKRIRKLEYTMISLMFARLFPNSRFMRSLILWSERIGFKCKIFWFSLRELHCNRTFDSVHKYNYSVTHI